MFSELSSLHLLDTQMWKFGWCTVPCQRSCHCLGDCPVCLCSNFLCALLWKTSWRNASELHVQKLRQKKIGGYISSVVNPECCADCSSTCKTTASRGRQRSSTAWMIAPFIVGRSGWQFDAICDISAGYASFWTWEWLASRRIVSGWHAASTADMENE